MSIDEIVDTIDSYERRNKQRLKETALLNYILAEQVSDRIAKIFDSKDELITRNLWDYFPKLFAKEKEYFENKKEEEEFEDFKCKRKAFARMYNDKRKEDKT